MGRYNTIIKNDVVNGEGVCVSFFVQGCPHRCPGCFNIETWDFSNGKPYTSEVKKEVLDAIGANNIKRNFSVLGGEPLASQNLIMTEEIVTAVRKKYPDIMIFLWTGYMFSYLKFANNEKVNNILDKIDVLIDGEFIEAQKNLDLKLRGSSNQRIWRKINGEWNDRTNS